MTDMLAAGLEPLVPYPGSQVPWPSRHILCGREVAPALTMIRCGQGGCKPCGDEAHGRRLRENEAPRAIADFRASGLEPMEPYPGAQKPWKAIHVECAQEVNPRLNSIRRGQGGCISCGYAGNGVRQRAELAEKAAALLLENDLETLEPYPGAAMPWRARHRACGREVSPRYHDVRRGHSTGCWWCSYEKRRIDPHAVTLVYVLHHRQHEAVKVGVAWTTVNELRVERFANIGWSMVGALSLPDRKQAEHVETVVLRRLRAMGFRHYLTERDMRGLGGHTETFDMDDITPAALWHLVREVGSSA